MFYHISSKKGLTELEPRVSTHGKAWVYALTDPVIGLVFAGRDNLGNKEDDSFIQLGTTKDNIPYIYELYNGCLDEIFKNKDAYIYQLEDSGFMANQTSWSPEWVSPNKTKVIGSTYIPDILAEIKNWEKKGKFIIHYYENSEGYNKFVESEILRYLNYSKNGWIKISLIRHYEDIVKNYVKENIDINYTADFENLSKEQLQEVFRNLDNEKYNGRYIRKELLYFYPQETIDWINKKYELVNANTRQMGK